METILSLQKRFQSLKKSKVRHDIWEIIKLYEKELAQYNRSQLFIDSKDVNGKAIGFYSKGTESITKGKKKAGQQFNLFDKGKFLPSIFSKVSEGSIFFGATDSKLPLIFENLLTTDIFSLTESNLNKIIEERFLPKIIEYFKKNLIV